MAKVFLYNNQLWRAKHEYTYTGHGEQVTLPRGEYLLVCNGAKGGKGAYSNNTNPGGSSYGVLTLNETTNLYAYVGGDGNDAALNQEVPGGYNGGGSGGRPYGGLSSTAYTGASGGGASDIRLVQSNPTTVLHTLPEEYEEYEYLKVPKLEYGTRHQDNVIDTGYQLKTESTIECKLLAPNTGERTPVDPPVVTEIYIGRENEWANGAWTGIPGGSWYNGWRDTVATANTPNTRFPAEPGDTITGYAEYPKEGYIAWVYFTFFANQTQSPFADKIVKSTWSAEQRTVIVPEGATCYGVSVILNPSANETFDWNSRPSIQPSGLTTVTVASMFIVNNDYTYPSGGCMPFGCINSSQSYGDSSATFLQTRTSGSVNAAYFARNGNQPSISGFKYDQPATIKLHGCSLTDYDDNGNLVASASASPSTLGGSVNTLTLFTPNFSSSIYPDNYGLSLSESNQMGFNGKIYYCKIFEGNELKRYLVPAKRKSQYPFTMTLTSDDFEQGDSDSGTGDTPDTTICRMNHFLRADEFRGSVTVEVYDTDGNPLKWEMTSYNRESTEGTYATYTTGFTSSGNTLRLYDYFATYVRFLVQREDGTDISPEDIGSFHVTATTNVVGMYDLVTQQFYANRARFDHLETGPVVETTSSYTEYIDDVDSMYSRIIVAGGGGGSGSVSAEKPYRLFDTSCGGGSVSGPIDMDENVITPYPFATQNSGNSFGYGADAYEQFKNNTGNTNGAAGGGGGWYGGYSSPLSLMTTSGTNLATMGSGGSGYVFTASSYHPTEQSIDSKYQLTNTSMFAGQATESSIYICEPVEFPMVGDTIICPFTGDIQTLTLPKGEYKIKCYGGDGGTRYSFNTSARGGYVEGVLTLEEDTNMILKVGGSGVYASLPTYGIAEYNSMLNPGISYNGGGAGYTMSTYTGGGMYGGGATDVRIDEDDLYNRLIVAGGAGGMGYNGSFAGGGGGLTGGTDTGGAMNGDQAGPGTQTGTPTSVQSANQGGFGYGGNGSYRYYSSGSGYGGAGGGGWYGGSGTYPDRNNDDDRAGTGGSGFVLSATSLPIVPQGYMLGEKYLMTNPVLTESGNNLPVGVSMIKIDVQEIALVHIICQDSEGYKIWDEANQRWAFYSSILPSVEDFELYGVVGMTSDEGLNDSYQILAHSADEIDSFSLKVTPVRQRIHVLTNSDIYPSEVNLDYEPNENYDLSYELNHVRIIDDNRLTIDLDVDKTGISDDPLKVYKMSLRSYALSSNRYIPPESEDESTEVVEESNQHKYLLTAAAYNIIPIRYINYLQTYQNETISTIKCSCIAENNRMMYVMLTAKTASFTGNKTLLRLIGINTVTGQKRVLMDREYDNGFYVGGMVADDNYVYFTSATNNAQRSLYRMSLSDTTSIDEFTLPSSSDNNINAYGKLMWLNDNRDTIVMITKRGFALFDTKHNTFELTSFGTNGARIDFGIGENYMWSSATGNDSGFALYDMTSKTWVIKSSQFSSLPTRTCFGGGKAFFVQNNNLYVYDESTMTNEPTITVPWSNVVQCVYANGVVYALETTGRLWFVDVDTGLFESIYLKWTISNLSDTTVYRLSVINGNVYFGYFMLCETRGKRDDYKYAVGYKYARYDFTFTSDNASKCTYDDRFVTFNETLMTVHNGFIESNATEVEENISTSSLIHKSEYNELIKVYINIKDGESNNES